MDMFERMNSMEPRDVVDDYTDKMVADLCIERDRLKAVNKQLLKACEAAEKEYLISDCHGKCGKCVGCLLRAAIAKDKEKS